MSFYVANDEGYLLYGHNGLTRLCDQKADFHNMEAANAAMLEYNDRSSRANLSDPIKFDRVVEG